MKFVEMIPYLSEGDSARRPHWKPNEYIWTNGKFLVHSTPYFKHDKPLTEDDSEWTELFTHYTYVCEMKDLIADDWEVVNAN